MVLRRIFGPKRDEVTGKWRILHNKELHDLYSLGYYTSTFVGTPSLNRQLCGMNDGLMMSPL
jgi:hypothetical protein